MSVLLKKKTVLSAAIESTPYTLETLVNDDSSFNVFDAVTSPTIEVNQRRASDGFSSLKSSTGLRSGTVTFKTDLVGDGSGGVPGWADLFFPACGFVKTGSTFAPVSKPPAEDGAAETGAKTLTIAVNEDGRRKMLRGCAGTFKIILESGKPSMIEWTFTGAWVGADDATLPTPAYPSQLPIRFADASLTIGAYSPCVQKVEFDAGNVVVLRECQTASDGSGYKGGLVSDRTVVGSLDPEAKLVAGYDAFGDWEDSVEAALTVVIADANDQVTITAPKAQLTNVDGDGERNGIRVDPLTFQANRNAAPDTELTIAFAAPA